MTSRTWSCISAPSTRTRNTTSRRRPSFHTTRHQSTLSLLPSTLGCRSTHLICLLLPPAFSRRNSIRLGCLLLPPSFLSRRRRRRRHRHRHRRRRRHRHRRPLGHLRNWPSAGTTRHARKRAMTAKTGTPSSGRTTSPAGTLTPDALTAARRRKAMLLTSPLTRELWPKPTSFPMVSRGMRLV